MDASKSLKLKAQSVKLFVKGKMLVIMKLPVKQPFALSTRAGI
jgi:hypothetical protein